ncbi:MAG: TerC/Alx family metal homeostasis membrane protein [Saprospiraceae bacterium]|nr:TerC/Alx family metal homeostasis membrane protein [Saprospiraceae bacterium]
MIAFWSYIIFISLAVLADYWFFAGGHEKHRHQNAIKSIVFWILCTCLSGVYIYFAYTEKWFGGYLSEDLKLGPLKAVSLFISGFLVEQSLSLDNIFVMAFLLSYFRVPRENQAGLLSIGIWTAIVLRGIMIIVGIWLITSISWMIYILGVMLIWSGFKIYMTDPQNQSDPNKSFIIRLLRNFFPVTKAYFGKRFFINRMGIRAITPMFLTLVAIEFTDILFAIDSIPAIFAITTDPFIVLSSNILAVANLRALFTILSKMLRKLEYIHYALAILLIYIGVKIMLSHVFHVNEWVNMIVIILVIGSGVLYSLSRSSKENAHQLENKTKS